MDLYIDKREEGWESHHVLVIDLRKLVQRELKEISDMIYGSQCNLWGPVYFLNKWYWKKKG